MKRYKIIFDYEEEKDGEFITGQKITLIDNKTGRKTISRINIEDSEFDNLEDYIVITEGVLHKIALPHMMSKLNG